MRKCTSSLQGLRKIDGDVGQAQEEKLMDATMDESGMSFSSCFFMGRLTRKRVGASGVGYSVAVISELTRSRASATGAADASNSGKGPKTVRLSGDAPLVYKNMD